MPRNKSTYQFQGKAHSSAQLTEPAVLLVDFKGLPAARHAGEAVGQGIGLGHRWYKGLHFVFLEAECKY